MYDRLGRAIYPSVSGNAVAKISFFPLSLLDPSRENIGPIFLDRFSSESYRMYKILEYSFFKMKIGKLNSSYNR